jgi:type IV secretory pathway VirB3-like protein
MCCILGVPVLLATPLAAVFGFGFRLLEVILYTLLVALLLGINYLVLPKEIEALGLLLKGMRPKDREE